MPSLAERAARGRQVLVTGVVVNCLLADIHVRVRGEVTVTDGHFIAHRVKDALMGGDFNLLDVTVHIEPA